MAMFIQFRRLLDKNAFRVCCRTFRTDIREAKCIKVGEILPDITVYEHTPSNPVRIRDVFRNKKGILFSVPGAFSPGCSQGHIPEYLEIYDQFLAEGYGVLACVCVNDPFVLDAWAKEMDPKGKMRMLADVKGMFTKAVDMELQNSSLVFGNIRSKRYTLLVDNNYVTHVNGEPDDSGLSCLLCIQRQGRGRTSAGHKSS